MLILAALAGLLVSMALVLVRAWRGPTVYDRILSANAFGSTVVATIAVFSYAAGEPSFLDIALVYALVNFISAIALLKYFHALKLKQ